MMEAIYPDGRREVINKIDWNHLWHTTHIYEDWAQPPVAEGHGDHCHLLIGQYGGQSIQPRP